MYFVIKKHDSFIGQLATDADAKLLQGYPTRRSPLPVDLSDPTSRSNLAQLTSAFAQSAFEKTSGEISSAF